MVNERKTENIIRELLRKNGYYKSDKICVEEQKSDNPKIQKLLKNASKKGNGCGMPEFIITSSEFSEFIVVIECKASNKKHESINRDKYSEYAVDGALLYSSFLSKEYDVLAIAVSGEEKRKITISQFIQLKGNNEVHQYFGEKIVSFDNYIEGYRKSQFKFNQDYEKLISYTKKLNELLHGKKIKESQRALLISGILIALKNDAFKTSYQKHKNIKSLIDNLHTTICSEIGQSDINKEVVERLKTAFSFLKTSTSLTNNKEKEFVEGLISDIDHEINGFMVTHKYIDTVSQFYVEFLRYANNDKGLGIVLTPSHITELFCELAEVNKDSVVLDNCCGTGGFLISAMKKMIVESYGNKAKEKKIKKNQLIGIEYQDDIYTLLVSNMILHRDGKTNMFLNDCFDKVGFIKKHFKPTVGLLNPPYKTKKGDIEELEFVLNNLEMLQPNSRCVAIIPISCVITQEGDGLEMKKKILKNHTLEAVMSMPIDLFHNSKVGVVTAAVVITAHRPHPKGKKTWFGYWRNDGFVKTKHRGRIDANNTWHNIKEMWVNSFKNKDVKIGYSVMKEVSADDEWCAEAYLETDYSDIGPEIFKKEIKKYVAFKIMNE